MNQYFLKDCNNKAAERSAALLFDRLGGVVDII
jgi:hypothetical protein